MENKVTEAKKTVQKRMEPKLKLINMDKVEVEQIENRSQHKLCIEVMDLLPDWTRAIESQYYVLFVPKT